MSSVKGQPSIEIIPAILTDNPVTLQTQISTFLGKAEWIHIDILDDTLAPGTTVPIHMLGAAPKELSLEVHLMVIQPERYFELCAIVGAKRVIVHAKALITATDVMTAATKHGFELCIAIDPDQKIEETLLAIAPASCVQVMGVHPGKQSQEYLSETTERIKTIHAALPKVTLAIDGGMTLERVPEVMAAGVQRIVVGSAIVAAEDPIAAYKAFREKAGLEPA